MKKLSLIGILNFIIWAKANASKDDDEFTSNKLRQTANSVQSQLSKAWATLKQNYLMRFLSGGCASVRLGQDTLKIDAADVK